MAEIILVIGLLAAWVVLDRWIIEGLDKVKEPQLKQLEHILQETLDPEFQLKRYRTLMRVRFTWVLLPVLNAPVWMWVVFISMLVGLYKMPYWNIKLKANKRILLVRYQFPIYLRQLQVLLQNNTIVKAIEASLDQVPDVMKRDIEDFHARLLVNPLDLSTYMSCMAQYRLPEIQRAMKWLYRYQSIGYQDAYRQFNRMILSTSKWLRQSRIDSKNQSILIYQWLGLLPLFGVTLVFLAAMMSVALTFFERR